MRSFFRSSSSRILVAAGTGALLVLIVILITGGFVIDAGPLHLSARRIAGPLVIALVAWTGAAWRGRTAESAAALSDRLETHATAIAVVAAAAAAGVGVAYGTYSAGGADASGYVSQAELLSSARLSEDEPLARRGAWDTGTWTFAPLGYRPGRLPGALVPTYAPGLPIAMAVAQTAAGTWGAFLVVPILGALTVACTYMLGTKLHSRSAGVVAAALMATSPIVLLHIVQPMSDVPATAWWALATVLASSRRAGSAPAAGVAAGAALLTRPNLMPLLVPVALLAAGWHPNALRPFNLRRLALFVAAAAPLVAALFLWQWRLYGSPLASGYGRFNDLFTLGAIGPNARAYAWRLASGEAPALCLALVALAVLATRCTREQIRRLATTVWLWAATFAALLICYLPYAVFTEWSYLRFLMPALPVTLVLAGALIAAAVTCLPRPLRGVVLLAVLTAACSLNVVHARRQQAFNMRDYDARYRTAGEYLDAALPDNAVVLAVQESGSVRYYAHTPIVRWDLIGADLDGTIARLRALGRRPLLLVEDWEKPDFSSRFKASPLAALDWTPRAIVGDTTQVLLLDPADRGRPPTWVADRLH